MDTETKETRGIGPPLSDTKQLAHLICSIEYKYETYDGRVKGEVGTGFLCQITVCGQTYKGLVTAAHVINHNVDNDFLKTVSIEFREPQASQPILLTSDKVGELRNAYEDIDATFIELSLDILIKEK